MYFQDLADSVECIRAEGRDIPPNERFVDGQDPRRHQGEMKRPLVDADNSAAKLTKVKLYPIKKYVLKVFILSNNLKWPQVNFCVNKRKAVLNHGYYTGGI